MRANISISPLKTTLKSYTIYKIVHCSTYYFNGNRCRYFKFVYQ